MSIAAQEHLRRVTENPLLLSEAERFLRANERRMEEFEGMLSDRSTLTQGTSLVHDDLYIWFRHNTVWERPEITFLTVLENERPSGMRAAIQSFECAIICGVIFTYDQIGDHLIMSPNITEPTGHWSLADDHQIGNAVLKLMMVNRA